MDAGDPRFEAAPAPASGRRASAVAFALLVGFLLLAAAVDATPGRATLLGVEGPRCPSTLVLGDLGCPGCGLTRGTALLLDGELAAATSVQPAAWLVVGLCVAAALLHGLVLVVGRKPEWIDRLLRSGRVVLLGGLLLTWLVRLP